jgi:nucleotide-binding universal stress UspA family protein
MTPRDRTANGRFRILAIANETVEGDALHTLITNHAEGRPTDVLVVAPALNTRLRHWLSDSDHAHEAAELRLQRTVARLDRAGVKAYGWVGDADPLDAIADALAIFEADQVVIATHPEGASNWLARNVVGRARMRFDVPIAHVVVDGARHEMLAAA